VAAAKLRGVLLAAIAVITAGVAPEDAPRHAVVGHFNVPAVFVHPSASPRNLVSNDGFETGRVDAGWYQCGDVPAYTTKVHPFSGSYDAYSGSPSGVGEPAGNSGICQQVTVPLGGILTVQLYQLSDEPDATFAYQEADLLDNRGSVVINLYRSVNNDPAWVKGTWNLAAYAGRTLWLYFGVHGDGYGRRATQQFVDEVSLGPSRE
jgi:hypothetical protein